MNQIIRYGIVGIGGMGKNHANLFLNNKIKNANLSAILDKDVSLKKITLILLFIVMHLIFLIKK